MSDDKLKTTRIVLLTNATTALMFRTPTLGGRNAALTLLAATLVAANLVLAFIGCATRRRWQTFHFPHARRDG